MLWGQVRGAGVGARPRSQLGDSTNRPGIDQKGVSFVRNNKNNSCHLQSAKYSPNPERGPLHASQALVDKAVQGAACLCLY